MAGATLPIMMDANAVTTIINNINSIYDNLINYTVGIIVFVGAVVPAVISFFQNRQFKREQIEIKKQINLEISKEIIETELRLKDIVNNSLQEEMQKIKTELIDLKVSLKKEIAIARGAAYHLQANQLDKFPDLCIQSCGRALEEYLEGEDENHVRIILHIIGEILPKINKEMLEGELDVEEHLNTIIKLLDKYNTNGRYTRDITSIKQCIKHAKKQE